MPVDLNLTFVSYQHHCHCHHDYFPGSKKSQAWSLLKSIGTSGGWMCFHPIFFRLYKNSKLSTIISDCSKTRNYQRLSFDCSKTISTLTRREIEWWRRWLTQAYLLPPAEVLTSWRRWWAIDLAKKIKCRLSRQKKLKVERSRQKRQI